MVENLKKQVSGSSFPEAIPVRRAKIRLKSCTLSTHPRGRTRSRTVAATGSISPLYDDIDWKLKKTGVWNLGV
jgi:hypothetical protein